MPGQLTDPKEYQNIFHWAETQKDGAIPSFAVRKNDPYEVRKLPTGRLQYPAPSANAYKNFSTKLDLAISEFLEATELSTSWSDLYDKL